MSGRWSATALSPVAVVAVDRPDEDASLRNERDDTDHRERQPTPTPDAPRARPRSRFCAAERTGGEERERGGGVER